jgi:hypothetical protein
MPQFASCGVLVSDDRSAPRRRTAALPNGQPAGIHLHLHDGWRLRRPPTVVTQKVYRHQLKPVITTGATMMNSILDRKKGAKSA